MIVKFFSLLGACNKDAMDTYIWAKGNVTNVCSSIAKDGVAIRCNDEAPPHDNEVTHL